MENILSIISATFTIKIIILIFAGSLFGMILGAIPGLTVTLAVAIVIPVTFYLNPVEAMALLISVYKSGIYGGSISAILIGTPGTPASAATMLDGYPLAKKGLAGKALNMALYSSVFADLVSNFALILLAAQIAKFALKFGPAENTMLVLFSLVVVSLVASSHLLKGILASIIGLSLSIVAMDPVTGAARFTFGSINVLCGIPLIPMLIGLFAISEIYLEYSAFLKQGNVKSLVEKGQKSILKLKEFFKYLPTLIKSSLIGVFIGALPGSGAATAAFLSYSEAKRSSKKPEEFGQGSLEGIAACEAGNNGVCGATLIPLLTLGIPGDSITAIMFGALVLQGITPGPLVFTQQGRIITGIYITLFMASLCMLILGKIAIKYLVKILDVRKGILFPVIMVICFVGTYAINNSMYDVLVMLMAGIVGYIFKILDMPVAPIIIGFILGPLLETSLLQALIVSSGSLGIFFASPITLVFTGLIIITISFFIFRGIKAKVLKGIDKSKK